MNTVSVPDVKTAAGHLIAKLRNLELLHSHDPLDSIDGDDRGRAGASSGLPQQSPMVVARSQKKNVRNALRGRALHYPIDGSVPACLIGCHAIRSDGISVALLGVGSLDDSETQPI